jgi:uncharacterized membrane protein YphA (DoxX/SURF4 family)
MKIFFGLLMVTLMLGGVLYQLVSGKLLARNGRPFSSRNERPAMYWTAISLETVGALAILYGLLHAAY